MCAAELYGGIESSWGGGGLCALLDEKYAQGQRWGLSWGWRRAGGDGWVRDSYLGLWVDGGCGCELVVGSKGVVGTRQDPGVGSMWELIDYLVHYFRVGQNAQLIGTRVKLYLSWPNLRRVGCLSRWFGKCAVVVGSHMEEIA